jgi:hypothetical protein
MKLAYIEGAILAALVFGAQACEREAFSHGRPHDRGHDGSAPIQTFDMRDGGPGQVAPALPQQLTGGSGGFGGTFGTGGSGGSGGTGGTGGTFGSGGTGGTGGTVTGGTGGGGGMATGGAAGAHGSY